jgi:Bacterial Ig-like domain (group 3)
MNKRLIHSFRPATIRLSLAALTAFLYCGYAYAQISTSATVSLSPQPTYQGIAPVATVTVTASDSSSPNGSVNCSIQTRGHAASYSANVVSGTANISLSSIAQVPVGTYTVGCTYVGSSAYTASSAPTTNFQVLAVTPTTTTVSTPSMQVTQGTTPTTTVSVAVSGNSNPPGTVSCVVRARAHGAAYRANLANGSATIAFTSLAQAPIGTYPVMCSYQGAGQYGMSSAAPMTIQVAAGN